MKPETLMLFETELMRDELMFGLSVNSLILGLAFRLADAAVIILLIYCLYRMYLLWSTRRAFNGACRQYNSERKPGND